VEEGECGNARKAEREWTMEGLGRECLVSEKETRIMLGKGKTFQKSPIQEYGKRATFASFVLPSTNALLLLYLVFMTPSSFLTPLPPRVYFLPSLTCIRIHVYILRKYYPPILNTDNNYN